jgi:pSer/pThr/pTyr-binding forkhead associated (FHA) protein
MKVSLVVAKGRRQGKVVPVRGPQFVIGRHKECHLKAGSSTISQHHCAVLIRDGKVFIRDFDSTNGTFVNQQRVQGEREAAPGDLLELGRLAFRVQIEPEAEEPSSSKWKGDDSMVAAMLLDSSDTAATAGILGLLDDSQCGSTVLQSPLAADERPEESQPQIPLTRAEETGHPKSEEKSTPIGQSDEIAKKLLDELHRSVRAKHNPT